MSHLSPPSPYARPSTPIPPNSPESPSRSTLASTQIHSANLASDAPIQQHSSSSSSFTNSRTTLPLPSLRSRIALGDSMMRMRTNAKERDGDEDGNRDGREDQARFEQRREEEEERGFDTLKSDFEFFFRGAGGEELGGEGEGRGFEGRARGRRVDGSLYEGPRATRNDMKEEEEEEEDISPSTTLWDSPDLGEGKGKGKAVGEEEGGSPQSRGLVSISPSFPANEGLGFDFQIRLDAASSSPVKGDTTITTSSSTFSLPVPQQRLFASSNTERPISVYSSTSGLDGDVSGSGGEESEEEEEEEERYEVSSSSPVRLNSLVVRRALVQIEGDVADVIASSSASDGETVSGDSAPSGDQGVAIHQRRANRLRKMQKEDCRRKAYPYTSTRPDYRANYLNLGSSTGDGGAQGDEEEDEDDDSSVFQIGASAEDTESEIADVSLDRLSALHLGAEVTTV